ncbi:hypothetical protein JQN58_19275 [Aneurinibacillus sp. BA2021]|nr:hypothetical protein [Aneurinibacillus sp. BA2021]
MFKREEKKLIQKLIQQKRKDVSIQPELRRILYSATHADYVFSTAEKEVVLTLLHEYSKKTFLWPSQRKLARQLHQKLAQSIRNESVNGISHIKPVKFT